MAASCSAGAYNQLDSNAEKNTEGCKTEEKRGSEREWPPGTLFFMADCRVVGDRCVIHRIKVPIQAMAKAAGWCIILPSLWDKQQMS